MDDFIKKVSVSLEKILGKIKYKLNKKYYGSLEIDDDYSLLLHREETDWENYSDDN